MPPSSVAVLRASAAGLVGRAGVIDPVFVLVLRAQAPGLAAILPPSLAGTLVAALMSGEAGAVPPGLDALLRDGRAGTRAPVALGLALMATLGHVLGPGFDDAAQAAWSEAYVDLVQRLMAARWNRMDLVA